MEEIRFNSEVLNKIMSEKIGKESFTKDEIGKELRYMELDLQGEKMTQEDLNILVEVSSRLSVSNADLSNVNLSNMEISEVMIYNCILSENFFDGSMIDSITLGDLETGSKILEKLNKVKKVKKLDLNGAIEYDYEAILKDYPNYYELEPLEKYNIMEHYERTPRIDISLLKELNGLEEMNIFNIELFPNNFCIPKIESLRSLKLDECIIHSLDIISQQRNITSLRICLDEKADIDTTALKEFTKLESLYLLGIKGVEKNLPFSNNNMKNISLIDCDISDANKILELYPQLMQMDLDTNPLTSTSIEDMRNSIANRKINMSFEESEPYQKLKSQIFKIDDPKIKRKLKNFLSVEQEDISLYNFITCSCNKIMDVEILNEILRLGVEKEALKALEEVNIDCFQQLSEKAQEYLMSCNELKIRLNSLEGLTSEKLDKFNKNILFEIKGDLHCNGYTVEELIQIVKTMEQIKAQIPENANEYEKFKIVYNIIGKSANYDNSGCVGSKEYIEGANFITRSLDGVLLQGRAVCAGYALALEKCLKYVGIETKKVSGMANIGKVEGGHAWNQVRIDGKWYNADLTWDYLKIQRGKPLKYCLVGDEMFDKEHKAREIVHKCDKDYTLSEVGVETQRPYKPNFGKGVPTLFGIQDYSNIAHETVIEQSMLDGIKKEIKKSQEQSKIKEENEK